MEKNKYEIAGDILLFETKVKIKKWRKAMSGYAIYETSEIVCPKPKTPKAFEVFAHEIGHIVANPNKKAPSWKRELEAIEYSKQQFKRFKFRIPKDVRDHTNWYGAFSICQALNRGMKKIPKEAKYYRKFIHLAGYKSIVHYKNGVKTSHKKEVWRAKC